MLNNKKIIVIMPAYNAEKTLEQTYKELDFSIIDDVILTDDNSDDNTKDIAVKLNIKTILHDENKGYGANQKTCYLAALKNNADVIVMLHPDYQYTPKLIVAMAAMIAYEEYDVALGSRMLNNSALKGKMPFYKFVANRFLTIFQNFFTNLALSEYHTGFRAFSRKVLLDLDINNLNDDFIFDNEFLMLCAKNKYKIGEITCPTKYFKEASSINFIRSSKYGIQVLINSILFFLANANIFKSKIYRTDKNSKLDLNVDINFYNNK